jgi:hypothetical protein
MTKKSHQTTLTKKKPLSSSSYDINPDAINSNNTNNKHRKPSETTTTNTNLAGENVTLTSTAVSNANDNQSIDKTTTSTSNKGAVPEAPDNMSTITNEEKLAVSTHQINTFLYLFLH